MFCKHCGSQNIDTVAACSRCGAPTEMVQQRYVVPVAYAKSRVAYVLFGLFLGGLGIHNFYAGYTGTAIAQLLISLLLGWLVIPIFIIGIWVLIEVCTVSCDAWGTPFR